MPVRFGGHVTPLAQFAVTVPAIDVCRLRVMSHFTSEQLPSGRPAIVDEPHAPMNAEPPVLVDPPPEDEPPPLDVAADGRAAEAPSLPEGAVGLKSSDVCSNAQPVASVEASTGSKERDVS